LIAIVYFNVNIHIHVCGDTMRYRNSTRIVVYLPKDIVGAIKQSYPEAKSLSEAVQRFILETLAGIVEIRSWGARIQDYARSILVAKYDGEYLDMLGGKH